MLDFVYHRSFSYGKIREVITDHGSQFEVGQSSMPVPSIPKVPLPQPMSKTRLPGASPAIFQALRSFSSEIGFMISSVNLGDGFNFRKVHSTQ